MRVKAVALLVVLVTGCGTAAPSAVFVDSSPVPVQEVPLDLNGGWLGGIVWLQTGGFAVDYDLHPLKPGAISEVWQLHPDGSNFHAITLPAGPECRQTEYHSAEPLDDGQLGLSVICDAPEGAVPVATYGAAVYDPQTHTAQMLASHETLLHPISISWNPGVDRAIASDGINTCGSLAWLTHQGAEPISMTIRHGSESWNTNTYFREHDRVPSYDCTKDGIEASPHWSADGRHIAFLASPPDSSGRGVTGRYPLFGVYLMDPGALQPRLVLDGLTNPHLSAWSPDSEWLVISADDFQGHSVGSWLFRPSSHKLYRIASENLGGFSWSSDGRRLVAVRNRLLGSSFPPQSTILIFDVRAVVSEK